MYVSPCWGSEKVRPRFRKLVQTVARAITLCGLVTFSLVALPARATPAPPSANSKALQQLLAAEWEYQLKEAPETATTIGDYRYNDRWTDYSPAHAAAQRTVLQDFLDRFQQLGLSGLSEQEQLSQKMMIRQLQDELTSIRLKNYEMPLDQINGVHLQLAEFVSAVPFDSTQHYQGYLKRLHALPNAIDQLIAASRLGLADKLVQPKYLLEKVATQADEIAAPAGIANVFGQPAAHFPTSMPAAEQQRLRKAILDAVDQEVRPAYRKLARFVANDYAPHGRTQEGIWALPDGDERYRFAIHAQTTTDLSPAQIHQIGLDEVARIEGQMLKIARSLGYQDLASLRAAVAKNPKLYATSREQILDRYRGYIAGMQPELPKLFGRLPASKLEVVPTEAYREQNAPFAEYRQGTPDGSRPGQVVVDTGDYAKRALYTIEDTAYHEGIPGHHLQIAIAQTLPLPPFRQQAQYNAYVEGWALYAERLAGEMGFYRDPYSRYGHLVEELLRADRLVLDTGVHYLHWNRQQMLAFFRAHPAEDEASIQAEVDRYVAWPAQALGYKLGQLKFLALRARAQRELGAKFDLRAFHDEMLGGGAMPLDLLDARTDAWIATAKKTGMAAAP
ncbi:DUF885 domain-containing protein [Dyella flagellata]|uniref:DUF885 domain-containing protein n=1 Tax=Dyella flagellata TaxID=1867833 RepID=UPI0024E10BE1|nr:DUF885 family protein [Dyella flagellata]